MVQLLEVNFFNVNQKIIPLCQLLLTAQLHQQIAEVKLFESIQFLDDVLKSTSIEGDEIILSVFFEVFFHLDD